MPKEFIKKDAVGSSTPAFSGVQAADITRRLTADFTPASSVAISDSIGSLDYHAIMFCSTDSLFSLADWDNGTYTWRWRVVTAVSALYITEVQLRRVSADRTTVRATKSTGSLGTTYQTNATGILSSTIAWNDGTQNPAGRQATDLLEIAFLLRNVSSTRNYNCGTNLDGDQDETETPLTISTAPTVMTPNGKEITLQKRIILA